MVEPSETLYEYDGPLIFRARLGIVDLLLSKLADRDGSQTYLACQTDDRTVDSLREGRLSVYGAFDQRSYWILLLDPSLRVASYWNCLREDLPPKFLPKAGLGLFHWHGQVPDSLEQSFALLAIKFRGASLTENGIPLGKLKNLVDQSFSTVRKLLTPAALAHTKSSTFDVEVAPPKLASLVIAVKEPVINMTAVRRIRALDRYTRQDFENAVRTRGEDFAKKLLEVQFVTKTKTVDKDYATENFILLDILSDILPDEKGFVSSVEFNAKTGSGFTTVVFDRDAGGSIRNMAKSTQGRVVTEIGSISGVISGSKSLRVKSVRGKEVTCSFGSESFDMLLEDPLFKLHNPINVTGKLWRRPRIDFMDVDSYRISDPSSLFG
ncbi:hypothetical protein NKI77_06785 [Mesorhizobium opportunistum]|uniref:hypothetical protein n=1 Tax=Mesorhizobium opportunistum TaxID=593909 RepID=UPI0033376BD7